MKRIVTMLLILMLAVASVSALAEEKPFAGVTLTVFNCYDYIDPAVIDLFEEETGARVEYLNYTDNEELYMKLEAGAGDYDVVFPSDYMVERLIAEDRLETIDMENVPNRSGILDWMNGAAYDPEGAYSVPYMWGTLGILYNTEKVTEPVDSWQILFEDAYAGDIIMMNSIRDTIGLALKAQGYSLNTREASEIQAAAEILVAQKKAGIAGGYMLDETKDKMVGDEAAIAIVYSGDALYAMEKNEALDYAIPQEGSNVWVDSMCIPKGCKNKECAEAFINFMCREDVALMNVEYIYYSSPITTVAEAMAEELDERMGAVMNPTAEIVEKCEFFSDISDCVDLYEEAWMQVRLAR